MKTRRILLCTLALVTLIFTCLIFTGCSTAEYTVTLVGDEHVRLSTDKTTYRKGETVVVHEDVDPGYYCNTQYGHVTFYDSFEMPNCDITVTATSYVRNYRITYVTGDEQISYSGIPVSEYNIEAEVKLPYAHKRGYKFEGWYTDESLTNPITKIEKGSVGDISVYPKFSKASYTITYHLPSGATNSPDNVTEYTMDDEVTLYAPEMEGREFIDWYKSEDFSGYPTRKWSDVIGDVELYPCFLSLDYSDDGYRIIRSRTDLESILSGEYDKEGKYRLAANIDYRNFEDTPTIEDFAGTFDGGGYSITNLKAPLFDTLEGATVENLSISSSLNISSKVESTIQKNMGALANKAIGSGSVTVRNVNVLSVDVDAHLIAPFNLGGMIGYSDGYCKLLIDGCTVKNISFDVFCAGATNIGGMLGYGSAIEINDSSVTLLENDLYQVECTGDGSTLRVGGMVGFAGGKIINSHFEQENSGARIKVYASLYCISASIGGLVGECNALTVEKSYAELHEINFDSNAKSITSLNISISGLVGRNKSGLFMKKCYIITGAPGLSFNSTIKKSGYPNLRFGVAYLACGIDESCLEECDADSVEGIKNEGEYITDTYILDDHLLGK